MKALVISVPQSRVEPGTYYSVTFDEIVASGIGPSYIVSDSEREQVPVGCKVVILDKDRRRRSESRLKEFRPTEKAANGKQRYDVCFETPVTAVDYQDEPLNRNGIAVIEAG